MRAILIRHFNNFLAKQLKSENIQLRNHSNIIVNGTDCIVKKRFRNNYLLILNYEGILLEPETAEVFLNTAHNLDIKITDCEDNEDLFLTLLTYDSSTSIKQWFVSDDGNSWEWCDTELPSEAMQIKGHKATLLEIFRKFKGKKILIDKEPKYPKDKYSSKLNKL